MELRRRMDPLALPFRGNMFDRYWTDIVNWLSIAGIVLALTGTVVGVLRWRFTGARYKSGSRSPYPGGMMKWHHTTGLLFAAVTITWVFSGLMSMNPWKLFDSGAPPLRTAAMHGGPCSWPGAPWPACRPCWRRPRPTCASCAGCARRATPWCRPGAPAAWPRCWTQPPPRTTPSPRGS